MRLRIKNGQWFETTKAIRVNDKLWYSHKGNWIFARYAEPDLIEESEAVEVMLAGGLWFEDHEGFKDLPDHVKEQLQAHLNHEFDPLDEV